MSAVTRSSAEVWLLGKATKQLSSSRLATNRDVLLCLQFHHLEDHKTVKESIHYTIQEVLAIWSNARIPTQRIDSCERKLSKLFNTYQRLKIDRKKEWESCRITESMFNDDLLELFDLAAKNAMETMKNEEDKQFLAMQREDVSSCSMAGCDRLLAEKEARKRAREDSASCRRLKEQQKLRHPAASVIDGSSTEDTDGDEEFKVPSSSATSLSSAKRAKNIISSPEVAGALDRMNIPDRAAMFVVASVAKALGHPLNDLTLSRSSIRRARMTIRNEVSETDKEYFSTDYPLLLHWDGKMLPDIGGGKQTVDRIAVLVTGNGIEQLLAVPKIESGTGEEQAVACLKVLDDWNIRHKVRGLVFDTTSSNTGIHRGACVIIEKAIGHELVNIACRHHIMEVILSSVFTALFGGTGAPEVGMFKRFQKNWSYIQQAQYSTAEDEIFDAETENLRREMIIFYTDAIKYKQPREDYLELLRLCLLFLGGTSGLNNETFRAPGPMHHARWMSKALYALKIVLFKSQLTLTVRETKGLTDFALFVALVYGRFWHEAPLAANAPFNDAQMLTALENYPNRVVAEAAKSALSRHLWYFSEQLIGLAFFDSRVSCEVKRAMVENLQLPKTLSALKRPSASNVNCNRLDSFVTERTGDLFKLLSFTGQEDSCGFLAKDPETWEVDDSFRKLKESVMRMKVVNDTAERGIALIQKYNETITKNEDQKQFLLCFVQRHRKLYPISTKAALSVNDK